MTHSCVGWVIVNSAYSVAAVGLSDPIWIRSDSQRGNRQQEHKAALSGGGVHHRALAGTHLPGEEVRQPIPGV